MSLSLPMIFLVAGLAGGAAVFLLALVLRATGLVASGCPRCGTPIPLIRKPANAQQAAWGGTTCSGCGVELDRRGRIMPGQ